MNDFFKKIVTQVRKQVAAIIGIFIAFAIGVILVKICYVWILFVWNLF